MAEPQITPRYAVLLRASDELVTLTTHARAHLRKHHAARAAALLPPHLPVKNFFLSAVAPAVLIRNFQQGFANWAPVEVHVRGVRSGGANLAWDLGRDASGVPNADLYGLQARVFTVILPVVSMLCDFTSDEPFGLKVNAWSPAVPLAHGDLERADEARAAVSALLPEGGLTFTGHTLDLYEFRADWNAGWTRGLTWRHLASVRATVDGTRFGTQSLLKDEIASWSGTGA